MVVTNSGYTAVKPSSAPTATASTSSGSLDTSAAYGYKVTYVTSFGETDGSTAGTVTTTSTGAVDLTAIPVSSDANVTSRKIYRTVGGGSSYLLLATLSDNTTTTYADTIADGSLGAALPTLNSAHSHQIVNGILRLAKPLQVTADLAIISTGTAIGDAYAITAGFNKVITTATGTGVILPEIATSLIGTHIRIRNAGSNTLNVYPFTGQTINTGSASAAITVASTVVIDLVAESATNWVSM
jgi:hypothetical protein